MKNCLTCKWKPKWKRNKNYPGVKMGDCMIPVPTWVTEAIKCLTGLQCDEDGFRAISKDKDGNTAASFSTGFSECPAWVEKGAGLR